MRPPRFFRRKPPFPTSTAALPAAVLLPPTTSTPNRRPYTAPQSLPPLSLSLRTSMRHLPHPVTILTTASSSCASSSDNPGPGITLSTLTCLSLSPYPLITFNVKVPSTCASSIHSNGGVFAIHLLRSTPHSAFLAERFAQLRAAAGEKRNPWGELRGGWLRGRGGVPVLTAEDDVMVRWGCEKYRVYEVEDHEIWVGRVKEVEVLVAGGEVNESEHGLMYVNRRFRAVGGEMVAEFRKPGEEVEDGSEEEAL